MFCPSLFFHWAFSASSQFVLLGLRDLEPKKDISVFFHVQYSIHISFRSAIIGKFWQELCVLKGKAQFGTEGYGEVEPGVWQQKVENTLRVPQIHLGTTQRPPH